MPEFGEAATTASARIARRPLIPLELLGLHLLPAIPPLECFLHLPNSHMLRANAWPDRHQLVSNLCCGPPRLVVHLTRIGMVCCHLTRLASSDVTFLSVVCTLTPGILGDEEESGQIRRRRRRYCRFCVDGTGGCVLKTWGGGSRFLINVDKRTS